MVALTLPVFIGCTSTKKPAPPKILWFISDGTYLYIDRRITEVRRYTGAFYTNPVCSPGRSTFMTTMFQATIGAHLHSNNPKVR